MNLSNQIKNRSNGQALTEMVLVIPILFLMAASIFQFSIFLSAKTYLEQACEQTARLYASGAFSRNEGPGQIANQIWFALGSGQRFFNETSIVVIDSPTSTLLSNSFLPAINNIPPPVGPLIASSTANLLSYTGKKWIINAQFHALPIFRVLFPVGLPMTTQMAVLKYPAQE
jgi:hypothetical protein